MTPEQERWAEALAVIRMHGDRAEKFVAERMEALAGDVAGRERWQQIGQRVRQVRRAARRADASLN